MISASYFYPRGEIVLHIATLVLSSRSLGPDGMTGDITPVSRPLKDDETMEWVLLSGVRAHLDILLEQRSPPT